MPLPFNATGQVYKFDRGISVGANGSVITDTIVTTATVEDGNTTVAASVTGTATTSIVQATIIGGNTNNVYLIDAIPTADTVTITVSGDPGADTTIALTVYNT